MDFSYSLEKVSSILEDFYALTNFRIALFDANFNELLAVPSRLSNFCKILREDTTMHTKCLKCDIHNFNTVKRTQKSHLYQCHAGLKEMIVPILSNEVIIGYLMCGQVRTNTSGLDSWEMFEKVIKDCSIDCNSLKTNFETQSTYNDNLLISSMHMVEILAKHLEQSRSLVINKESLSFKIDEYILAHLKEPLHIPLLCQKFNYQKSTFYKVTNKIYPMGIMKHIKHIRIQKAKHLLSTTNLNISEIAEEVGIEDYNYFTKIFKIEENCTPREYRKNNISCIR